MILFRNINICFAWIAWNVQADFAYSFAYMQRKQFENHRKKEIGEDKL